MADGLRHSRGVGRLSKNPEGAPQEFLHAVRAWPDRRRDRPARIGPGDAQTPQPIDRVDLIAAAPNREFPAEQIDRLIAVARGVAPVEGRERMDGLSFSRAATGRRIETFGFIPLAGASHSRAPKHQAVGRYPIDVQGAAMVLGMVSRT